MTTSVRSSPAPSRTSTPAQGDHAKRKRPTPTQGAAAAAPAASGVYSQPADTGTGRHLMTNVTYAIEYLKSKDRPISFRDILNYLSIQDLSSQTRTNLLRILKTHSKVEFGQAAFDGKGSFRFRPTHNVRSADELEAFLQQQTTAQGIHVKELKDGWPGCLEAIDQLEREGKILVTRNKKDSSPKMVWSNDPSLMHEVENDFKNLWHSISVPTGAGDLRSEIVKFGLTPTSLVKAPVKAAPEKRKKRGARKSGKTTNTHMAGVLKDYSHLRK